jgi:hypothetical protein
LFHKVLRKKISKKLNKKMKKKQIALLLVITLLLSSCSQKILNFTIISSKNFDLTKASTFVKAKDKVLGKSKVYMIIIVPTGTFLNFDKAINKAIESVPGCVALVDGKVYRKWWMIPVLYLSDASIVEGTPLIDPSLVYNSSEISTYNKIELDRKSEVTKIESISSIEYEILKSNTIKGSKELDFNNTTNL